MGCMMAKPAAKKFLNWREKLTPSKGPISEAQIAMLTERGKGRSGKNSGTKAEKREAVDLLQAFQLSWANVEYVQMVNALIPGAMKVASKVQPIITGDADKLIWDRAYHLEMGRLKREAGLIK